MSCSNCLNLTSEVAEIRTIVERLDHELLGNGQPGRVKEIETELGNLKIWRAKIVGAIFFVGPLWTALVAIFCVFLAAKLKAGN